MLLRESYFHIGRASVGGGQVAQIPGKNKEVKMTRRYLHPANGRRRRNAGVDEQILLYPVAQFILTRFYSPFQSQKSEGNSKMAAFEFFK